MQPVSQDDLEDVKQLTKRIEGCICEILDENGINLSMSALISACINCILNQCENVSDAVLYRKIFIEVFDIALRSVKIKDK